MLRVSDYSMFTFWGLQFLAFVCTEQMLALSFASHYLDHNRKKIPFWLALAGSSFFMLQLLSQIMTARGKGLKTEGIVARAEEASGVLFAAAIVLTLLLTAVFRARFRRKTSSMVLRGSIKEAVDRLPKGICFCQPGGRICLSNEAFEQLAFTVSGETLKNGDTFWQQLTEGRCTEGCAFLETGEKPVIGLSDGRIFMFERKALMLESLDFAQITATDHTESYIKTASLKEKKLQLEDVNGRLRLYSLKAEAFAAEKETLATKIHVHDTLGEQLLAVKRYLIAGEGDPESLAEDLSRAVSVFREPSAVAAAEDSSREELLDAASKLGVEIVINGEIPADGRADRLIMTALSECLTNTIRHAGGDRLYLDITEEQGALECRMTNNGRAPEGPVAEKGGLKFLRAMAENMGCTMTLEYSPAFALMLHIPM